MPLIKIADTTCFYRLSGPDEAPVLMLAHALGQDHGMWDPQIAELSEHFRVLRYDIRGHGASEVTGGDYRIEQLAADALALADALAIDRFAFCGLSLGGMLGQWLAANAPQRVTAAVLANTAATADAARMQARREAVLSSGMASIAEMVMTRFFSPRLLAGGSPIVASARRTLLTTSPVGYAGCCAAIRDMDLTPMLNAIRIPILIVDGELDVSLPWRGFGEVLAREIAGARIVHLDAAHLSNIERPRGFTSAVLQFLMPSAAPGDARDAGMRVRRGVLGDAHVDRAVANAAQTSEAFQDLITRFAWGTVWARPGLDLRTRRLLVLAITAAMGRWEEFRLHARTGFAHELEWCDVEETLLHTAIYAGVPAANTAFQAAAGERRGKERD
jgi:3-oxoadipate enol-lactonase/4-carboxymuconolactone decarboxylase